MIENNKLSFEPNLIEKKESWTRIKNIATRSFLIAGVGLSLLSYKELQPKTVYAHPYTEPANIIEMHSNQKITSKSYEFMNIPNDTIDKQNLFEKNIVITIDDCYNNDHTKSIFETLTKNGTTATFFPNTMYLNKNNDETVKLWREIYNSGFEIGYHTTNHEGNMSIAELQEDYTNFTSYMQDLLGEPNFSIKAVRPPYGTWDENWNKWVEQNDLLNVRWNMGPGESSNYAKALIDQNISPIVILHSRYDDARWLERNINNLKDIATQNNSNLGSVYHSLPKQTPTEQHINPILNTMEIV